MLARLGAAATCIVLLAGCGGNGERASEGEGIVLFARAAQATPRETLCSGTVRTIRGDGSNETELALGGCPAWSPSGDKIVFVDEGIAVMNEDGTDRKQLTKGRDLYPSWAPDGSGIAFIRLGGEPGLAVWIVKPDGTEPRRIAQSTCCLELPRQTRPAWSPGSKHLAFSICRWGWLPGEEQKGYGHEACGIQTMAADGSATSVLTRHEFQADSDLAVGWAPRESLTIDRCCGAESGTFSIEADGTGLTRIPAAEGLPAWSPDGRTMAFDVSPRFRFDDCKVLVARERAEPRKLADLCTRPEIAWSPDGAKIVVAARSMQPQPSAGDEAFEHQPDTDIFTIEVGEGAASPTRLTSGPDIDYDPSWQPTARTG